MNSGNVKLTILGQPSGLPLFIVEPSNPVLFALPMSSELPSPTPVQNSSPDFGPQYSPLPPPYYPSEVFNFPPSQQSNFVLFQCQFPGCSHQVQVPDFEYSYHGFQFIEFDQELLRQQQLQQQPPQFHYAQGVNFQQELVLKKRKKGKKAKSKVVCNFCVSNREPIEVYTSHTTKNENGEVICPILAKYVCPTCGDTGIKAHTIKYCPKLQNDAQFDYKVVRNAVGGETTLKY